MKRHDSGPRLAAASTCEVIDAEDGDRLRIFWSRHDEGTFRPSDGDTGTGRASDGESGTASGNRPVLVVLHGLTGCADADNVMAIAAKGFGLGFDVVRVDLRNSQGESPSLGVGHAGRSEDFRAVTQHVRRLHPDSAVATIGFSLGGNIALKALGEYSGAAPDWLRAVATISVPIDLDNACHAIDGRRQNWVYRTYFLRRLGCRYRTLHSRHPDLFPELDYDRIRGIRDWDNAVVAPLGGFEDAADYYARCSALKVIDKIRVPSLIVQAKDDPFIPFEAFERAAVRENPWLKVLSTPKGGHVGFFARAGMNGDPDRFWAENRALAFCAAAVDLDWIPFSLDRLVVPATRAE